MSQEINERVNFKISGSDLNVEDGYDLYYLSQSMEVFHQLIEKTYLTLKDEKYMSRNRREDLKIKVFNIKPGSFEADFVITVSHVYPSLLPIVTSLTAENIWKIAKESFDYLKVIFQANQRGEEIYMENNNTGDVNVYNVKGDLLINTHPDVVTTAVETYPTYKKMANLIDEKDKTFEKAEFSDYKSSSNLIKIGVEEKMLLQNKNIIEEEPIEFIGKIFNADANKNSGKLEVLDSKDIPTGEYSFEFLDKRSREVKEFFDEKGEFSALKESAFNPNTLKKSINKLRIVKVYPSKND
ncbi:hypothetical protein [Piscibacillus salipiscarius]|uniref:Uncharacterized protein n=1 Tax=Piscibacillus salipiscarius TaxID=299480 RepID=A0ABW5Q748_9BACI|nr:hypothetical protein [Piscibacillus salipiscarius]